MDMNLFPILKRSTRNYGKTEQAVTPYQKAAAEYDGRLGNQVKQASNWRVMAFVLAAMLAGTGADDIARANRGTVKTVVIEVDHSTGEVVGTARPEEVYKPTDKQIAYNIKDFIDWTRSVPNDPVVLRKHWQRAYNFLTDKSAQWLTAYAQEPGHDPKNLLGIEQVIVSINSVVRESPESFQIRWTEDHYKNGTHLPPQHWTAHFKTAIMPQTDEDKLNDNPLGVYFPNFYWAQDNS